MSIAPFTNFEKVVALSAAHLIRKFVRIRIRLTQAVAAARDWLFYSSLSGPRTTVGQGFVENKTIKATFMEATEKKISTFNLNLNWFDS